MSMNTITHQSVKFINRPPTDKLQPIKYSVLSKELRLPKNLLQRIVGHKNEYDVKTISPCNLQKIQQCFKAHLPPHRIENLSEIFKERPLGEIITITEKMRAEVKTAVYEIAKSRPACIRTGISIDYRTLGKEMDFLYRRLEQIVGYEISGQSSQNRFMTQFELQKIQRFLLDYFSIDDLEGLLIFNLPNYNDGVEIEITPTLREEIKSVLNKIINVKRNQAKQRRVDLFSPTQEIKTYDAIIKATYSTKGEAMASRVPENLPERENASYGHGISFKEDDHLSKRVKTSSSYPFSTSMPASPPEFKFFFLEQAFKKPQ